MKVLQKPIVAKKFHDFYRKVQKNDGKIGTNLRILDFSYHNICNFKCEHCFTKAPECNEKSSNMSLEKLAEIADQAHELGVYEFDLQGGELLVNPKKLFDIVKAIKPERFYVYLTTNGYFLDRDMAKSLAEIGVDRVSVSIDSMNAKTHDEFRGCEGAHERALKALEYVKEVGIAPYLNITVGRYNVRSKDLEDMFKYSQDKGYISVVNIAIPSGCWEGNEDIIMTQGDRLYLQSLREKYGNIIRDIWNPFDRKEHKKIFGCNAINRLYMTPKGDILACPFMQVKIGNVYEKSLKEIVDYGFSIKHFSEHRELCLAGEDIEFMNKYLKSSKSIYEPIDAQKLFKNEDYT